MQATWEELEQAIRCCERCGLCAGRHNVVPGEGNRGADVMLIGEGPGQVEDETGRPFVGPAGQLLDKMLAAIGHSREDVYIANVVKCRPPSNRVPLPEEAQACLPYLRAQFLLIKPKILVCLGSTAARNIIRPDIIPIQHAFFGFPKGDDEPERHCISRHDFKTPGFARSGVPGNVDAFLQSAWDNFLCHRINCFHLRVAMTPTNHVFVCESVFIINDECRIPGLADCFNDCQ